MSSTAKSRKRSRTSSQNSGAKKSSKPTSATSSSALSSPETTGSIELAPVPFVEPERLPNGQFAPGQSGNPAGRPPNARNALTEIKQDLELAVRKNISPQQIAQIVHRMYLEALAGSVGAAKLILDKTISNAKTETEDQDGPGTVKIVIENMTLGPKPEVTVIEHPSPTTEE